MDPAAIIRRSGHAYASNVAVWFEGREQTYHQLFERACRLANLLRDRGLAPGDRVAVLGDNAFESVEQAAACALGNYPRATLYTYNAPSVNRYLLELTGARALFIQAKYHLALAPLLADLPGLETVVVFAGDAPVDQRTLAYDGALAGRERRGRACPGER